MVDRTLTNCLFFGRVRHRDLTVGTFIQVNEWVAGSSYRKTLSSSHGSGHIHGQHLIFVERSDWQGWKDHTGRLFLCHIEE